MNHVIFRLRLKIKIKKTMKLTFVFLCLILAVFLFYILFQSQWDRHTIVDAYLQSNSTYYGANHYSIAIVVVVDTYSQLLDYFWAQKTLACYSIVQNYTLVYLYMENETYKAKCKQKDLMFARHCATVEFMQAHPEFNWILFLDADIGVINPRHIIEEFVDPNRDFDLVFYDRMYNWEIMAGSYLAKNTKYARNFLRYWAEFQPPNSFHGTDNGVIHEVFMHKFATKQQTNNCDKIYFQSRDYEDLFKYEACVRHSLGEERSEFVDKTDHGKVKILGKGKAWVRDGSVMVTDKWSSSDFMVHGWKNSTMNLRGQKNSWIFPFTSTAIFETESCQKPKETALKENWRYKPNLVTSNAEIGRILALYIYDVYKKYKKIVSWIKFE